MIDRRAFIKQMGRSIFVGGLIAGSGYLLLKPDTGRNCNFNFICRDCKQIKSCTLPEAEDYKKNKNLNNK